jgi:hypothetical protein
VLLAAGVVLALVPAASAQTLLFDYLGFDYEDPNPVPGVFGEPGSGYVGIGTVPFLFAPIVSNTALNEYTYVMQGLSPVSAVPAGPYLIINYSPGTITLYEDPISGGTTADYGANPPNATVLSTFTDGTAIVVANLTSFQFIVNTLDGTGSYEAVFDVVGGSQLANFPLNQRQGWTFAGSTGQALNIPPGYYHQIDGQTFLDKPTAAKQISWGRLKSNYR